MDVSDGAELANGNIMLSKTVSACQAVVGNYGGDQPCCRAKMEQSAREGTPQVSLL